MGRWASGGSCPAGGGTVTAGTGSPGRLARRGMGAGAAVVGALALAACNLGTPAATYSLVPSGNQAADLVPATSTATATSTSSLRSAAATPWA